MRAINILPKVLVVLTITLAWSRDNINKEFFGEKEAIQHETLYYNSLFANEKGNLYSRYSNLRRRLSEIPSTSTNSTTISSSSAGVIPSQTTLLKRIPGSSATGNEAGNGKKMGSPIPFKETKHPENGPVIAVLLANRERDIEELCLVLRSLVLLKGDKDKDFKAPVLVFQEGDISDKTKGYLVQCTDRLIAFPFVDFKAFPTGFDMKIEGERFEVKGRSEWGYYQMIRFWLTRIWDHPALKPYETIMRIDSDSCFNEVNEYLPNFKHKHLMYHSQYVGLEDGKQYVLGLLGFAEDYLKQVERVPRNVVLWDFIKSTWNLNQTLPLFMTNMEVSRKSFMHRPEIRHWHEALTEREPFGVMRKRWGDADIRFLTAAMFMGHDEVLTERASGYRHKERCLREEIEAAIKDVSGPVETPL